MALVEILLKGELMPGIQGAYDIIAADESTEEPLKELAVLDHVMELAGAIADSVTGHIQDMAMFRIVVPHTGSGGSIPGPNTTLLGIQSPMSGWISLLIAIVLKGLLIPVISDAYKIIQDDESTDEAGKALAVKDFIDALSDGLANEILGFLEDMAMFKIVVPHTGTGGSIPGPTTIITGIQPPKSGWLSGHVPILLKGKFQLSIKDAFDVIAKDESTDEAGKKLAVLDFVSKLSEAIANDTLGHIKDFAMFSIKIPHVGSGASIPGPVTNLVGTQAPKSGWIS